jgi:hypothetical protein
MGFRFELELLAIATMGAAAVVLLFAATVRFAVTRRLRQIREYVRDLQDDPSAPAPAFHSRELNELATIAAASRTPGWSPEPAFSSEHRMTVARNVRLAREYVDGITVLLEVSRQYSTPLPDAAIKNLHYLKRLLDEAGDSIGISPDESAVLTSTTSRTPL